jgi:ribosomal protein S18 acetylase RimI-like enzyme
VIGLEELVGADVTVVWDPTSKRALRAQITWNRLPGARAKRYRVSVRIERVVDADTLERGSALFDDRPLPEASLRCLTSPGHHLLFAWDDTGYPVGFISGVELTHPDKGTEMYLNELGVTEVARGRGVATSLVEALADLAKELGCYGMWEVSDPDNIAALATYRSAGAQDETPAIVFSWQF